MKSRIFYIALNLVAPGLGQFGLKWYIRGTVEMLGCIACIFWAAWLMVSPILTFMRGDMTKEQLPQINWPGMATAVCVFMALWLWSMLEIFIFYKSTDKKP